MFLNRWVFKQLYDTGLVYRGVKVMPFSTACNTPLSNFESHQNYKVRTGHWCDRCFVVHTSASMAIISAWCSGECFNTYSGGLVCIYFVSRMFRIHPWSSTSLWLRMRMFLWLLGQPHPGHCQATWPFASTPSSCMSKLEVRDCVDNQHLLIFRINHHSVVLMFVLCSCPNLL